MINNFCHLHVHNEYSLLDGYGSAQAHIKRAKELGFSALGLTNHGNIDGLIKFQQECDKNKIIPILGCEAYIVSDATKKTKGEKRGHVTLLIKNQQGYENLCKMLTWANLEGFYYKPRIDFDLLYDNCDGLVILTGCAASFLNLPGGEELFFDLHSRVKEDLYLEVMPHLLKEQVEVNKFCDELSLKYDIPLVGTNDCHYILPDDDRVQEVLLAIQTKALMSDPTRYKFSINGLYLKTLEEMQDTFDQQGYFSEKDIDDALFNTMEIVEKCKDFRIKKQDIYLPAVPGQVDEPGEFIWKMAEQKLLEISKDWTTEKINLYFDRLGEEWKLINEKKFTRYFCVVYELVQWCRKNDILVGPGRGSVGGSLLAYLLNITTVDPIKYNLLFSRFISENRTDLPDIDLDFEDVKRHLVREHLEELYGKNNISSISTFLSMKGRAAIRDVARVFEIPLHEVDAFAKAIGVEEGEDRLIAKTARDTIEGKVFARKYPGELDIAIRLEGQIRGCVSGECRVLVQNINCPFRLRIKKIKKLYEEGFRGKIRSFDFEKGIFFFDSIKDIYKTGIKETIKLEAGKKSITLTPDHKILTLNDWKTAGSLSEGDVICTNGQPEQIAWNKGIKMPYPAWNKGLTKEDHPSIKKASKRWTKNNPSKKEINRKKVSERSKKHGLYTQESQNFLLENPICQRCGENKSAEKHHIDKNRFNNKRTNWWALCIKCHHELHPPKSIKISDNKTVNFSRITKISDAGKVETYDICMESRNQNFVCNKIVTHNSGQHAAAIIVSADDLTSGTRGNLVKRSDMIVSNWDMSDSEYVGLMKLDVLGLNTLSILNETKRLIDLNKKKVLAYHPESDCYFVADDTDFPIEAIPVDFAFEKIPLNDQAVFKEISEGNTIGVFQMNAWATTRLAKQIKCENIFHWSDIIALVRPGPSDSGMTESYIKRKHGEKWKKKHPTYERIVEKTYGIVVYQEQVMKIIHDVGGLSYTTADKIRKIIGKKHDAKEFAPFKESFAKGCKELNTLSETEVEEFWNMLQVCASYMFNESHSVEYAIIGFWTAWCKYYFPHEFICAALTYGSDTKKEEIIEEAYRLGLNLVLPTIGKSDATKWIVKDNALYVPFIEIKGVGDKTALQCLELKPKSNGNTKGFFSKSTKEPKKTKLDSILEELGAFDGNPKISDFSKYFSFRINTDKRSQLPGLIKAVPMGFPERETDKWLTLDILPGQMNLIKKVSFNGHQQGLADCKDCSLWEETEFGPVPPSAGTFNLAIWGEAPGENEDKEGIGFVGKSGNLLWDELKKYDLYREDFHISNCCKCYPSKTKTPTKEQLQACWQWNKAELLAVKPCLTLAFGNTGLKTFAGKDSGIIDMSGKTTWNEKANSWICWCIHPSAVLHNPSNKQVFQEGIKNFAEKIKILGGISG